MLHENRTGEKVKVRLRNRETTSGYEWRTILPGETARVTPQAGEVYGLTLIDKRSKRKLKNVIVSTTEQAKYWAKLVEINGIGARTADQIVKDYPTEKELIKALKDDIDVTSRDDHVDKLKDMLL